MKWKQHYYLHRNTGYLKIRDENLLGLDSSFPTNTQFKAKQNHNFEEASLHSFNKDAFFFFVGQMLSLSTSVFSKGQNKQLLHASIISHSLPSEIMKSEEQETPNKGLYTLHFKRKLCSWHNFSSSVCSNVTPYSFTHEKNSKFLKM